MLSPPDDLGEPVDSDGTILRVMSIEDRLLETRLAKNCHAAYDACTSRLREMGLSACLMDVEHLFDGHTLIFYFLGNVDQKVEQMTDELAEVYEAKVQFRPSPIRSLPAADPAVARRTPRARLRQLFHRLCGGERVFNAPALDIHFDRLCLARNRQE